MAVHPQVSIGHMHFSVASLEGSLGFYWDVLGLSWWLNRRRLA